MKKTIRVLAFLLVMMTALTIVASASDENTTTYTYETEDTEYTVIFSDSSIPQEKQEAITQKLIGLGDSSAQTYGLGCVLFGHDYLYEVVHVVTHKVYSTAPRCKQDSYDVTLCEDCDYFEEDLYATAYIDCCPED